MLRFMAHTRLTGAINPSGKNLGQYLRMQTSNSVGKRY